MLKRGGGGDTLAFKGTVFMIDQDDWVDQAVMNSRLVGLISELFHHINLGVIAPIEIFGFALTWPMNKMVLSNVGGRRDVCPRRMRQCKFARQRDEKGWIK